VNNGGDIVDDILLLSGFIVKRNGVRSQVLKDCLDIDLWATCNAYVQIWKAEINQLIDKLKDFFPGRWNARIVRALVKCVQDNISRTLQQRESKHLFETFCHGAGF
jgi:hypothetical protein